MNRALTAAAHPMAGPARARENVAFGRAAPSSLVDAGGLTPFPGPG